MRARASGLALGLSLLAAPAVSNAVSCFSHTFGESPFLCAFTFSLASLGGSQSTVNGVEYFDLEGGPADSTGAGSGGLAGTAFVNVDWGVVEGTCTSDNGTFTTYDPINAEARDISNAEGAFGDIATLASATLPPGTPVALAVRVDAAEGDTPGAGVHIEYDVANDADQIGTRIHRTIELGGSSHTLPDPVALSGYAVGDSLIFAFWARVASGTTNRVSPARVSASAQLDHARLVFDIDTPDVTLISPTSGHDYTTVPEAAQALLMAAGAWSLAWRSRARRARGRREPRDRARV